jgi:nucleoside-diphosphate-sugar epimerase
MNMIVITGSQGYLGLPITEYCRARSEVRSIDIKQGADVVTDLLNVDDSVFEGADAIIHLAAIPSQGIRPPRETFLTNVTLAWNVLEAAYRLDIKRVVMVSSIQVNRSMTPRAAYPQLDNPLSERESPSPQEEYGLSKFVGEHCAAMFSIWGLTTVSLRFPLVASEEIFEELASGKYYPYMPLGAYLHIKDAARVCYLAATAPLLDRSHHVMLVAAKNSISESGGIAPATVDCSLVKTVLGFEPEITCAE